MTQTSKKIEELSEVHFFSDKNEKLKNSIIDTLTAKSNKDFIQEKLNSEYKDLSEEIKENSNILMTTKDKSDQDIIDLLSELINDFKEQSNLKKIEYFSDIISLFIDYKITYFFFKKTM